MEENPVLSAHLYIPGIKKKAVTWLDESGIRRYKTSLKNQDRFDEPCQSSDTFSVSDVCLHTPKQELCAISIFTECLLQCTGFDRVACSGSSSYK